MNREPSTASHVRLLLRAQVQAKMLAWVLHWNAKGNTSYSDHLLLERIYTKLDKNIDKLGERHAAYFGPVSFADVMQLPGGRLSETMASLLALLKSIQVISSEARKSLDSGVSPESRDGLDDYFMSLNNTMDTFIYLVQARLANL